MAEAAFLIGEIVSIKIKYLNNTYPPKQRNVGVFNLGVGEDKGKNKNRA